MSDLSKAWKNGKRGKFRRIDGGKLKFIRSEDGKVEKDATSIAGHDAQLGSPAAEVMATGGLKRAKVCKCGSGHSVAKCGCKVEKHDGPGEICKMCGGRGDECVCNKKVEKNESTCDCTHEGLCKEAVDCNCDCTDRDTCRYRISDDQKREGPDPVEGLNTVLKALEARVAGKPVEEGPCPTCGRE